jgi:hypothetical protein
LAGPAYRPCACGMFSRTAQLGCSRFRTTESAKVKAVSASLGLRSCAKWGRTRARVLHNMWRNPTNRTLFPRACTVRVYKQTPLLCHSLTKIYQSMSTLWSPHRENNKRQMLVEIKQTGIRRCPVPSSFLLVVIFSADGRFDFSLHASRRRRRMIQAVGFGSKSSGGSVESSTRDWWFDR